MGFLATAIQEKRTSHNTFISNDTRVLLDEQHLEITECAGIVHVEHHYPDPDEVRTVEIGLAHVRCVDDIRVRFDFDRNAWIISQLYSDDDNEDKWVEASIIPVFQFDKRTDA